MLDFYNPRTNWLARCFTIEYATWFRLVLPGLQRLGLPIPLGGTTLFFRRRRLEALGGWDAHNVTEDADLGIRLARHGYRTELIAHRHRGRGELPRPALGQAALALAQGLHDDLVRPHAPPAPAAARSWAAWRFSACRCCSCGTLSQFLLAPLLWSSG